MAHPILMPKAGQSMTEGKIVSWLKKEGEPVGRGDPLLEIETDKANLEVEAGDAGILRKIFHREGEVCPVLAVLGVIGAPDETIDFEAIQRGAPPSEKESETFSSTAAAGGGGPPRSVGVVGKPAVPSTILPSTAVPSTTVPSTTGPSSAVPSTTVSSTTVSSTTVAPSAQGSENGGRAMVSPLAKRVARERGVDLRLLRGTGPGGRILRQDVEEALAAQASMAIRKQEEPTGPRSARPATPLLQPPPYPQPSPRPPAQVAMEGMRKAIGSALQQSKQAIPHFYVTVSIDVTAALELKRSLAGSGLKATVNDLVVRAAAIALTDEPRVNCRVFADRIEYPSDVNIGIAVGSDDGLLVPVILKAQDRDLAGIAAETQRLIAAARSGKLLGSGKGTFTVSNLGMFGVEAFTAIINPPEGAILAVGAPRDELVPCAGGFLPRQVMKVTLSSDHRAIDGILAAKFLARLKHVLEGPERL